MIGDIPRLFGRDFIIAFFAPGLIAVASGAWLAGLFDLANAWSPPADTPLAEGILAGALAWLTGIVLLTIHIELIRLLEGFGRFNPLRLLLPVQARRLRRLETELDAVELEVTRLHLHDLGLPAPLRKRYNELRERRCIEFPDDPAGLLPTRFGNTLSAWEGYPLAMYGYDGVNMWLRLLACIPAEYRSLADGAKAQMTFWVNAWFLGVVGVLAYAVLCVLKEAVPAPWVPLVMIAVAVVGASRARLCAATWGGYVKSAFDTFLPELDRMLGLAADLPPQQRRAARHRLSQALTFAEPDLLPDGDAANGDDIEAPERRQ